MHKQWRERTDVAQALIFKRHPLPGVPCFGAQRVRRRAQPKQVHHHHFVVIVPAIWQKTDFRHPAVRQQRRILRKPGPLHTIGDVVCQQRDVGISKMGAAGEDSAKQDRSVHRRNFRVPNPLAGIDVGEVIKEAAMVGKFL